MIDFQLEDDGRWIAEIPSLPGVLAYGDTKADAQRRVLALALHVIADRIEHAEAIPADARDLLALA